jgi:hypothetical protein
MGEAILSSSFTQYIRSLAPVVSNTLALSSAVAALVVSPGARPTKLNIEESCIKFLLFIIVFF